jgi:hypothetical protein
LYGGESRVDIRGGDGTAGGIALTMEREEGCCRGFEGASEWRRCEGICCSTVVMDIIVDGICRISIDLETVVVADNRTLSIVWVHEWMLRLQLNQERSR